MTLTCARGVSARSVLFSATDEELDNFTHNHACRFEDCGGTGLSIPKDLETV